jgi:hypothetical protein
VQYQLFRPVIVHDPTRRRFPLLVRAVLGLIDANDFLALNENLAVENPSFEKTVPVEG